MRLATPRDAPAVHAIYAPIVRDTFISFELEVPSIPEIEGRIAASLESHAWLVFEERGDLAGYAYASEHRERAAYQWSTDVSCYVHARARRRGIGARLYQALFRILALQGFTNAFAGIALPNAASLGMHEAVGFVALGRFRDVGFKQGEWHDTVWMQRQVAEPPARPEPPRPLAALSAREIEAALAG
ncbi:MAG TPA: arsinothricin resistance N-acetyltransferase ArsN1 family B [Usitatibacter sp.]|jgi:phosphinothricin acetyltransferase|nr:arsinothricin resistance N-acetyltransferase ArsN1 family B [Usitatibacter sp.]